MNREQLVDRLRRAGVPEALYEIPGVHEVAIQLDPYYFLRHERDGWLVGLRQRSQDSLMGRFTTEAEACEYLHDTITRLPPPAPGAPSASADSSPTATGSDARRGTTSSGLRHRSLTITGREVPSRTRTTRRARKVIAAAQR
ncbi:hypothetical protein [Streptacidiphilus sp. PB12-B1b]|uniref:hypothetical protein n=1 Tax=Streptacidiphilus sp. PB12-B1b TaxID=2705012 RepID=UPI0015FAF27C|nr:hypothetical protein [Streptacidiphilus sp. PB12-B1b]